ncbi:Maturase MatK, N-terminal domain-containing protein, partial [Cynara cardunculus var. scolymus]
IQFARVCYGEVDAEKDKCIIDVYSKVDDIISIARNEKSILARLGRNLDKFMVNIEKEVPYEDPSQHKLDAIRDHPGVSIPDEVDILPPSGIRNKGCGTGKRLAADTPVLLLPLNYPQQQRLVYPMDLTPNQRMVARCLQTKQLAAHYFLARVKKSKLQIPTRLHSASLLITITRKLNLNMAPASANLCTTFITSLGLIRSLLNCFRHAVVMSSSHEDCSTEFKSIPPIGSPSTSCMDSTVIGIAPSFILMFIAATFNISTTVVLTASDSVPFTHSRLSLSFTKQPWLCAISRSVSSITQQLQVCPSHSSIFTQQPRLCAVSWLGSLFAQQARLDNVCGLASPSHSSHGLVMVCGLASPSHTQPWPWVDLRYSLKRSGDSRLQRLPQASITVLIMTFLLMNKWKYYFVNFWKSYFYLWSEPGRIYINQLSNHSLDFLGSYSSLLTFPKVSSISQRLSRRRIWYLDIICINDLANHE